jgi:hypothetical protein
LRVASARAGGASVAVAAALTAGMVFAPAAGASSTGTVYSASSAGYLVSGRWFGYLRAGVQLPTNAVCAQLYAVVRNSAGTGSFSITAELGSAASARIEIVLSDVPTSTGCGTFTGDVIDNGIEFPLDAYLLQPGDPITLSVYYNPANYKFNTKVSDPSRSVTLETGATNGAASTFTSARVTTGFGSFAAPASKFRPFAFTGSQVITYTGARGTMTGPWTTSEIVETSNGKRTGVVRASSGGLWDGGQNFSLWVRPS